MALLAPVPPAVLARAPEWIGYTNGDRVNGIGLHGDDAWVGTNGGLVHIDGSTGVRTFYDRSNSGLRNLAVLALHVDPMGAVWMSQTSNQRGYGGGVFRFDGTTWTSYRPDNSGIPEPGARCFASAPDGSIWMGSGGVTRFDGVTWSTTRPSDLGLLSDWVNDIAIAPDGTVWVGVRPAYLYHAYVGGGLLRFDGATWSIYTSTNSGLPSNYITSLAVDPAGALWIGAQSYANSNGTYAGGVTRFDGTTWTHWDPSNSTFPSYSMRDVVVDPKGVVWAATARGAAFLCEGEWKVAHTGNSGLPSNDLGALAASLDREIWIGTRGAGVARFDGIQWTLYDTSNSDMPPNRASPYSQPYISALAQDTAGAIWMGLEGNPGGLVRALRDDWTFFDRTQFGVDADWVSDIAVGPGNDIWVAVLGGGLVRFDGVAWSAYHPGNSGLESTSIVAVDVDAMGNVWVGSSDATSIGGVYRFDGSSWTHWREADLSWGSLAVDAAGHVWAGGWGLMVFDGTAWAPAAWPGDDQVDCLLGDRAGNVWVGTSNSGLGKFDGASWTVYDTTNSGIPADHVTSLTMGEDGVLWVGTCLGGLARLDGAAWQVFTMENSGINDDYCIGSLLVDRMGNTWIGTLGVSVYREGGVASDVLPPGTPDRLTLRGAVPNPFNPATLLRYELPYATEASLALYDVRGKLVRSLVAGRVGAGVHAERWDGRDDLGRPSPSGVYVARLVANRESRAMKLVLVR